MYNKDTKIEDQYAEFYEHFNNRHNDPLVQKIKIAYHWFIEILGEHNWALRREEVLVYFNSMNTENTDISLLDEDARLAFYDDWVAWYLYLIESLADKPTVSAPPQFERIKYFFAVIGENKEKLMGVKGIDSKLNDLLIKTINQPDSILFELVVAICYLNNGWEVEFIPETGAHKTPDIKVVKGINTFYVECKRLAKVTQYSESERKEWLIRWKIAQPVMIQYHKPTFFNVIFKTEIVKTHTHIFLDAVKAIYNSRELEKSGVSEFSSEDIYVRAHLIDMQRVNDHLEKWYVKCPSPQLYSLLDEKYDPCGAYTVVCKLKPCYFDNEEPNALNTFIDDIDMPFCVKWVCIAEESINKKAKDIKKVLVGAVNQAPMGEPTIVHIGYETLHGPEIELVREKKIRELISKFDFMEKDIAIIYCHSFQSLPLINGNWDFAETTQYFSQSYEGQRNLLEQPLLLANSEETTYSNEAHWVQDLRNRSS